MCKSDEALLQGLRDFMLNDLMFGPLQFTDPEGHELGKVSNVTEMMKVWADLPLDSVAHHARHAHLSRWFFGRAEFALAKRFRDSVYPADFIDDAGKERPDWLRNWILTEVRNHRNKLASTVENANTADESTPIVRYGTGSLGGKGRGFRFLHNLFDKFNMQSVIPDMELHVPRCFILATSVFEDFLDDNELLVPALNATTDQQVDTPSADSTRLDSTPLDSTRLHSTPLESRPLPTPTRALSLALTYSPNTHTPNRRPTGCGPLCRGQAAP